MLKGAGRGLVLAMGLALEATAACAAPAANGAAQGEAGIDLNAPTLTLVGRFLSRRQVDSISLSADVIEVSWALRFQPDATPGRPIEVLGYARDCPADPPGDGAYRIRLERRRYALALRGAQTAEDFSGLTGLVVTACQRVAP
ncbi:MAG: hypothetical protein JSR86_06760 [Proteobacteria bacterium]|nr:hypothetical protein [Pseudomonadota bacterium]